jgi:hypothetical protein
LEKDVAAGEAESCYRSFHAAVLGLTVRYRLGIVGVTSLRGRTHCLYWDAYAWDAEDADGGAVANDRVLGSRVGWARACVAEELGMAAWEPEEKDLSLVCVVSLLLACCIVPGLDGVFSGHLVCPRCGG